MAEQPASEHDTGATKPRYDRYSAWKWTTLTPLLAVLLVFVTTIFDPFDFESVTKRQSARIFYKIYATLYPAANRDKIAVVLLDDETLAERPDETWPPSHLLHGDILDAILSYKPAAVLVDIFFLQSSANDHFARLKAVIDRNGEPDRRVPLFFVGADLPPPMASARPELRQMAEDNKLTLVSARVEGEQSEAPLYPLRDNARGYVPAALAIYRWICADPNKPKFGGVKCAGVPGRNSNQMEVVWGLEPAEINCKRAENSSDSRLSRVCDEVMTSPFGRAVQLLWEALIPRDWRPTDPMPIPYHAEISAKDVLHGDKRAELGPWLTGKIVLYGARLSLVKDVVYSPVHGETDGVFFHAMALDNLMTYGDRYVHEASEGTFRKDWTEFQPVLLMLVAGLATMWHRKRLLARQLPKHALHEADEHFLLWARRAVIGLIIVAGGLEFFVWGISPFNWIGLIIVIHLAHWIEKHVFEAPQNG